MKLYKVEQVKKEYTTDLKEVVNRINCRYFVDVKNAKAEYFKAKKHYTSCKPESIKEDKHLTGMFANFWSIEATYNNDGICTTYQTTMSEIETSD